MTTTTLPNASSMVALPSAQSMVAYPYPGKSIQNYTTGMTTNMVAPLPIGVIPNTAGSVPAYTGIAASNVANITGHQTSANTAGHNTSAAGTGTAGVAVTAPSKLG